MRERNAYPIHRALWDFNSSPGAAGSVLRLKLKLACIFRNMIVTIFYLGVVPKRNLRNKSFELETDHSGERKIEFQNRSPFSGDLFYLFLRKKLLMYQRDEPGA